MEGTLDTVLKERLRAVLEHRPATEGDLRRLFEEGRACELILSGLIERSERRLAELAADPESSLAEAAEALQESNELRLDLGELQALLADLTERAREVRASWLTEA
jgi:hypothetical protein